MLFEVAVHFFAPHPEPVILQSHLLVGQVGSQAPGFFFASLPVDQQVGWIDFFGGQVASTEPVAFTSLVNKAAKRFSFVRLVQPDTSV